MWFHSKLTIAPEKYERIRLHTCLCIIHVYAHMYMKYYTYYVCIASMYTYVCIQCFLLNIYVYYMGWGGGGLASSWGFNPSTICQKTCGIISGEH